MEESEATAAVLYLIPQCDTQKTLINIFKRQAWELQVAILLDTKINRIHRDTEFFNLVFSLTGHILF